MSRNLYIIDGHAHIYAAYYAPITSNLVAPDGEPTRATYIFTAMLMKLLKQRQPDMLAVTMDSKGKSFRHDMYADYKANRSAMPEDMPVQIERIQEILDAMNIPVIRKNRFEADDLIGTIARLANQKKWQVYICSKDKDLEQLITENVVMYDMKNDVETDVNGLMEKKGIAPNQVIDALALEGDTSDNVPGVPDVGPKTALQWIQKYGGLDNLIKSAGDIKGKRGANLRAGLQQLELSRKLVTIDCNVDVDVDFKAMEVADCNKSKLAEIYQRLGFHKLLNQLGVDNAPAALDSGGANYVAPRVDKTEYSLVDTPAAFTEFMQMLGKQKYFAVDTETTGLNPIDADMVGVSFSWKAGEGYYLPVKAPLGDPCLDLEDIRPQLQKILGDDKIKKVGQNIKYDISVFRKAKITLKGVAFDTMLASYVLNNDRGRHDMDSMARDYLGHETIKISELIGKGKKQITFDLVDTKIAADYAAEDADVTWRLKEYLDINLTDPELRKLLEEVELPLIDVLAEMEFNGVALDVPWLKKLSGKMSDRLDELTRDIYKEAGCSFNIDSPKQLGQILFEKLSLPKGKKTKTGYSTDQSVLESLQWQHKVPAMILEYRRLAKLKNTYADKLPTMICPETRRIHGSFNQTGAVTGRLSSSDPNLQNIPIRSELGRQIRKAFVPQVKGDLLMAADYSQIELRLLAHFSQDPGLLEAFNSNVDIHQFVASQVFGVNPTDVEPEQRSKAKAVNFGIIYGQSAFGLSQGLGIPVPEASKFIENYFRRYPSIRSYMDSIIAGAQSAGRVTTILGRKRNIIDINSPNVNRRKMAERMAVNTVIQGSAADLIKVAMINIHHRIDNEKLQMKMILQVHDELVFELPEKLAEQYSRIITDEMTTALKLDVPIIADVAWGKNWLECK